MPELSLRLDMRISPAHRQRLDFIAAAAEVGSPEIVRAFLEGYASVNGYHLTKSFRQMELAHRNGQAPAPDHLVTVAPSGSLDFDATRSAA
jgi:hypothetical protein